MLNGNYRFIKSRLRKLELFLTLIYPYSFNYYGKKAVKKLRRAEPARIYLEIPMYEMKNEFMNHESIRDAITICERVIYGKKILKREEYEKFLRSLGNGFISPHITWMVRKNGN